MSRNTAHIQLNDDITHVKNQLVDSVQNTKDLKAKLKDLSEKKKEAGKAPRNIGELSNKFNIEIPAIQGVPSALTNVKSNVIRAAEMLPGPSRNDDASDIDPHASETPQTAIKALSLDACIPISVYDTTYIPVLSLIDATQVLEDADTSDGQSGLSPP